MRILCVLWAMSFSAAALADTPHGIYRARPVADSPLLLASGMAWSKDGLNIADRKEKVRND